MWVQRRDGDGLVCEVMGQGHMGEYESMGRFTVETRQG